MGKILILAGTNRPGSNTGKVAVHVHDIYRAAGIETDILNLAALPAEIFDPSSYAEKPESFAPFSDAVLASSGIHLVTPEYNGGIPGVLKYFIDMLPFPESFERRPVAFTGIAAGMWGALRPVEQLQAIFAYRNAHLYPERVFIPFVNNHLTQEGRIGSDEILDRLRAQVQGFTKFTQAVAS